MSSYSHQGNELIVARRSSYMHFPNRRQDSEEVYYRRPINRREFFHERPSNEEIDSYFYFDKVQANKSQEFGRLDPLWTCTYDANHSTVAEWEEERNRNKLVFLHMWRSAGATIRALLRGYAYYCGAGIATVNHCTDLGREYMEGPDLWANARRGPDALRFCVLDKAENRTKGRVYHERISTAILQDNKIDILAGHLPLGCDEFWDDDNGQHVNTQFVVFLREPLEKFVSKVMFIHQHRNLTVDEAVVLVNETVNNATFQGKKHRESYSNYLITPEQHSWIQREQVDWTFERRVNISLSNLSNKRVLVGIVERLPETMALLQYILDRNQEVTSLFRFFSLNEKVSDIMRLTTKAKTEAVTRLIRNDSVMLAAMDEFLKFDHQIYDWGLQIHNRQVESLYRKGWAFDNVVV